jgi:hypothetical protein
MLVLCTMFHKKKSTEKILILKEPGGKQGIRTLARGCQLVAPFILAIRRESMPHRSLARLLVVFMGRSGPYIGWYICI